MRPAPSTRVGVPGGVRTTPSPSRPPPGPGQPPHRPQQPDPPPGPRWHQVSGRGVAGRGCHLSGDPNPRPGRGHRCGGPTPQPPAFHRRGSSSSLPSGSKASLSGECRGETVVGRFWDELAVPVSPRCVVPCPGGAGTPPPSQGRAAALPFGIHVWFSAAPPAWPPFAAVEKLPLTSNLPLIKPRR